MRQPAVVWNRHDVVKYKKKKISNKPIKLDHLYKNNFNNIKNVRLIDFNCSMVDIFESYKKELKYYV